MRANSVAMDTFSPLLLAVDQFTLEGNGAFHYPKPQQIMNPNQTAMLVDEFRFAVGNESGTSFRFREYASILAALTFGNSMLTNQAIPLSSFCPTYVSQSGAMAVWHPPKPLYVPAGVQLGLMLQRKNPFPATWSSTPGTVFGFAIAGRSLPFDAPVPQQIAVPWACATTCYSSVYDSTLQQTPEYTSKDNEICNPFDADLSMSYLTGLNVKEAADAAARSGVLVQATYGSGKLFVRDPTPFSLLFPANRPITRTRGVMKPKDFLKVQLSINATPGVVSDDDNELAFTTLGLTGYRMMNTPPGVGAIT